MSAKEVVKRGFVITARMRLWVIVLVILCVYGKTLKFDFIGLDDRELIVENYEYISHLSNLPKAFTTHAFYNPQGTEGSNVYYRPLLTVSLMLDAQIGGMGSKFYHLTNILIHIICCLLLLKLLVKFGLNEDLAFFFSLLFAVHPMLAQAVAWIPGRNDSLLALFVFAAFINLIEYAEVKRTVKLILSFLFFGLSLFTKESAVAFPVMGVLYIFLFSTDRKLKNVLLFSGGCMLFLVPWFFLRQQAMQHTTADLSFSGLSTSFIENLPLLLQFIQKSLLPFYLSILSVPADTNYMLSVALIVLLAFLLLRNKTADKNKIFFGIIWFSAFLLPSFLVKILTGFEHRAYLPLLGLLLILSEIEFLKHFSLKNIRMSLGGASVLLLFLIVSVNHTNTFSSNYEFWKTAATHSKHSALARMNYGLALSQNGERENAIVVYQEGLSINPDEPLIHNNLGILYARSKMYEQAEAEFKKEFKVSPQFSDAYFNMGILYQETGKDSLMLGMWRKAISINPKNTGAKNALERYYKKQKK